MPMDIHPKAMCQPADMADWASQQEGRLPAMPPHCMLLVGYPPLSGSMLVLVYLPSSLNV